MAVFGGLFWQGRQSSYNSKKAPFQGFYSLMDIKYPYRLHRGYFCPLVGLFFIHIKEASFPLFGYFVLSYFSDLFTLIPFIHRLFRTFLHYYYFRYFVLLPIFPQKRDVCKRLNKLLRQNNYYFLALVVLVHQVSNLSLFLFQ